MLDKLYRLDGGWTRELLYQMNGDLIDGLGIDLAYPQGWEQNPITKIVRPQDDRFWNLAQSKMSGSLSGVALVRAQAICQQAMWLGRGPEGDQLPKTLRKLWYAGHKEALQHISKRLDIWRAGDQMNDTAANGCLSQVYGEFVDSRLVTYLDLWVKDGSRLFNVFDNWARLPAPLGNIVMAIEKDAAYEDCTRIGRALGAAVAMSGGGKMGKAGTENMVRSALSKYWDTSTPGDMVTEENPCYVLAISDWDYDGEAVIAPTFVEQLKRYVPEYLLHWVRVGIRPLQVEKMGYSPDDKAYQVKYHVNSAYTSWCRDKALFQRNGDTYYSLFELESAEPWAIEGAMSRLLIELPMVQDMDHQTLKKLFERIPPLGYELDALKRVEYAGLIVDGLLQLVSWETLVDALSRKAWSDNDQVTDAIIQQLLSENEDYQELDQHISELEDQFAKLMEDLQYERDHFATSARETILPLVERWQEDERIAEDDPEAEREQLEQHMRQRDPWQHWQPFSIYTRNRCHQRVVELEEDDTLEELRQSRIDFSRVEFNTD